ncbi:hypothetical protein Tco_0474955 [Tanacetum coccineum]
MCTYLKNIGGYKHNQLKGMSYKEIQKLFNSTYRQVNSFVAMDSDDKVKGSEKKEEISEKKTQGSRKKSIGKKRAGGKHGDESSQEKRAGDEQEQGSSKRQRIEDDKEEEELKQCFELVIDDDEVTDAIPLATKPIPIVDF